MYLRYFDLKREQELIKSIKLFQDILSKNTDKIKIIVSDLSKRLFNKMCEDGLLKPNDAFTDLEEATKEYIKRKQTEEFPNVYFILSPEINECFGDEEMYYIEQFNNKLIELKLYNKGIFDEELKMVNSERFFTIKDTNSHNMIGFGVEYAIRILRSDYKPNVIDIIRYILGIYQISDDKVIITNPNIIPKINNWELASKIFEEHINIIEKESRYSAPEFDKACKYYDNYLATNFMKTKIDINNLSKEDIEELDNYAKWNLLTKDTDGNYHINYYTYSLLLYILNGYNDYTTYKVVRFFWNEENLQDIVDELCIKPFEKYETNPDKLKRFIYFAQEYSRILEGKYAAINRSLELFKEYKNEVDLFKELLESRKNNLTLERKL